MWPTSSGMPLSLFSDLERFRDEMDSLFNQNAGRTGLRNGTASYPPLTVAETAEDFRVGLFAPGYEPADFDVTIQNTILTLRGSRKAPPQGAEQETCHRAERPMGAFTRAVTLPDTVEPSQVHATYKEGLLTVFVGKRTEVRPKRIEIKPT